MPDESDLTTLSWTELGTRLVNGLEKLETKEKALLDFRAKIVACEAEASQALEALKPVKEEWERRLAAIKFPEPSTAEPAGGEAGHTEGEQPTG